MVTIKQKFRYTDLADTVIDDWLSQVVASYDIPTDLIKAACLLAQASGKGLTTFYGQSCLGQGLEMAEIILDLKLDQETVAAAILLCTNQNTQLSEEKISMALNPKVAHLLRGVQQMGAISQLQKGSRNAIQIDRLRKMFLSIVSDIRVVLIKLAERMCVMRGIKNINSIERKLIAQETMDIYAPLANRLGVGQLKWELEDTAFHYMEPISYKNIAKFLATRRTDREVQIAAIIINLTEQLTAASIEHEISGRAKHIYSIHVKAKRKDTDYQHVYDCSAIRVLVPTIADCYTTLGLVHNCWEHIPSEFDDYISKPKGNGYRSIHTAVIGPNEKIFEIQIRTFAMHEEAERGVAAHWAYKENAQTSLGYQAKVDLLRQLLNWQQDVAEQIDVDQTQHALLSDRVYVFTPTGDILDLPARATPLDAAYHIHSEIGNHCRGAKVNQHIVQLTTLLKTGDQIEILTNPNGTPSRDWLNAESGYLNTPRARAKVAHWFRQQDFTQHVDQGRKLLEREMTQHRLQPNLQKLASLFQQKDEDNFLASIGRGTLRLSQIMHTLAAAEAPKLGEPIIHTKPQVVHSVAKQIAGINDFLTRIARCCKPIPGDEIVGFITQGRGVSIHKKSCPNVKSQHIDNINRILPVSWDEQRTGAYYVDIQIHAQSTPTLLKEVTTLLANARISLNSFNSNLSKREILVMTLTIQITALPQLNDIIKEISQLRGVLSVKRLNY